MRDDADVESTTPPETERAVGDSGPDDSGTDDSGTDDLGTDDLGTDDLGTDDSGTDDDYAPGDIDTSGSRVGMIVVAVCVLIFAALPYALGYGPFGLRLLTASKAVIHVLNISGQELTIDVSFSSPKRVRAIDTVETLTGPIRLIARDADGQEVERFETRLTGDLFYNATGAACIAVFDLTDYYVDGEDASIRVARRVFRGEVYFPIEAATVVLPRRAAPNQARGTVHWIEQVNCDTLQVENEEELLMWAEFRLRERRERLLGVEDP